jgi:hypothetical protein
MKRWCSEGYCLREMLRPRTGAHGSPEKNEKSECKGLADARCSRDLWIFVGRGDGPLWGEGKEAACG